MRKLFGSLLLVTLMIFALVPSAAAITERSGVVVKIEQDQTIEDELVIVGESVTIDGTVNGDVFAAGTTVIVNGAINGNLFAAADTVQIKGTVTGTAVAAGDRVLVSGHVDRNLVSLGATVVLEESGSVGNSWFGAADRLEHHGNVQRGMAVAGSRIRINGLVVRELRAGVETLEFGPKANVNGPITYNSENLALIDPAARIGQITQKVVNYDWHFRDLRPWYLSPFEIAVKFGGFLAVGLAVLGLFPRLRSSFPDLVASKPWQAPLTGFLALIAIPVASVILMITLIGLPLGIFTLLAFPILIYVSQILLAWAVGRLVADRVEGLKNQSWPVIFLLGALLTSVAIELPFVGWVVGAAALIYGLGALLLGMVQRREAI